MVPTEVCLGEKSFTWMVFYTVSILNTSFGPLLTSIESLFTAVTLFIFYRGLGGISFIRSFENFCTLGIKAVESRLRSGEEFLRPLRVIEVALWTTFTVRGFYFMLEALVDALRVRFEMLSLRVVVTYSWNARFFSSFWFYSCSC